MDAVSQSQQVNDSGRRKNPLPLGAVGLVAGGATGYLLGEPMSAKKIIEKYGNGKADEFVNSVKTAKMTEVQKGQVLDVENHLNKIASAGYAAHEEFVARVFGKDEKIPMSKFIKSFTSSEISLEELVEKLKSRPIYESEGILDVIEKSKDGMVSKNAAIEFYEKEIHKSQTPAVRDMLKGIEKYLPKEQSLKKAGVYGVIGLVAGVAASILTGKKKKTNEPTVEDQAATKPPVQQTAVETATPPAAINTASTPVENNNQNKNA